MIRENCFRETLQITLAAKIVRLENLALYGKCFYNRAGSDMLLELCTTQIRPRLEYGTPVCYPYNYVECNSDRVYVGVWYSH